MHSTNCSPKLAAFCRPTPCTSSIRGTVDGRRRAKSRSVVSLNTMYAGTSRATASSRRNCRNASNSPWSTPSHESCSAAADAPRPQRDPLPPPARRFSTSAGLRPSRAVRSQELRRERLPNRRRGPVRWMKRRRGGRQPRIPRRVWIRTYDYCCRVRSDGTWARGTRPTQLTEIVGRVPRSGSAMRADPPRHNV